MIATYPKPEALTLHSPVQKGQPWVNGENTVTYGKFTSSDLRVLVKEVNNLGCTTINASRLFSPLACIPDK